MLMLERWERWSGWPSAASRKRVPARTAARHRERHLVRHRHHEHGGIRRLAPKTPWGTLVTGIWIIISVIAASSLVAGIASTLTLTGLQHTVIATAEQLCRERKWRSCAIRRVRSSRAATARDCAVCVAQKAYDLLKRRRWTP